MRSTIVSVSGIISVLSLMLLLALWFWREPLRRQGIYAFASLAVAFGVMLIATGMTDWSGLPTILSGVGLAWSLYQVLAALLKK